MNQLEIKNSAFYIDDKEIQIISGDIHYFRIHPDDWAKRLDLAVDFGLNTIQTYVPWNRHEPRKGDFNFEGMLNLPRFLELAKERGLYVLLRPSPFICSECDLGGIPARLLKNRELVIRTSDPAYLKEVEEYYRVLCTKFVPYLATNGGNIIAVAIENEYGSYGNDHLYIKRLAEILVENGVDVPFYTTDGDIPHRIAFGRYEDHFMGLNFRATTGTSQPAKETALRLDPDKPFFIGEFWAGRSMHWGEPFKMRDPKETSEGFREALELGASVDFYMFSGGTNFDYMSGADFGRSFSARPHSPRRYIPHTTSYDVDALIREDGTVGEKYFLCRDVLDEYLGKAKRPHIAPEHKVQSTVVKLTEKALFFENLEKLTVKEVDSLLPKPMEDLDQDYGVVVYHQTIDASVDNPVDLTIQGVKDRATVYRNGKWFATYMRDRGVTAPDHVEIRGEGAMVEMKGEPIELTILAENLGRINHGPLIPEERKGIDGKLILGGSTLFGCKSRSIDLEHRDSLSYREHGEADFEAMQPIFLKGSFDACEGADTYVNFAGFGHGYIFINGFNLGHFDGVGPAETLYLPAGLLKAKENVLEIVDFAPTKYHGDILLVDHHILEGESEELF